MMPLVYQQNKGNREEEMLPFKVIEFDLFKWKLAYRVPY